jgi:nucleoside-diphosphate-sugar epimerase
VEIADVKMKRNYILDAPLGVRGRNSDNTLIREYLDWEPSVSLKEGIDRTYGWIYEEVQR